MSYGHDLRISDPGTGKPTKSVFVPGTRVVYDTSNGRCVQGQVVGPDQDYFPSPVQVFVAFPARGFTHLVPVDDLKVMTGASNND